MTVAAVVVRWRGGDEVDRCLRSLLSDPGRHLTRIVLVDSGSGDGGAERLAAAFPDVEVIALPDNRSFAHAANAGVAASDDDLVLLLNPDTEIGPGALDNLVAGLEGRPRAAGAMPLLVHPDGSSQHRWQLRRLPTVARLAAGLAGAAAFRTPPRTPVEVPQPAAAAWLVRRSVWRSLGGLDEGFAPAWWEDVDFCARLAGRLADPEFPADRGFSVLPEARVVHLGGSSLGVLDRSAFLAAFSVNLVRYAARHHPGRLRTIRAGLSLTLAIRAILRPKNAGAYLDARRAIRRRIGS